MKRKASLARARKAAKAAVTPARAAFQQHLSRAEGYHPQHKNTENSMEHSDMEALGFQLRDYYEEVNNNHEKRKCHDHI